MDVFPVPVLSLIVVSDLIIGNRGYVSDFHSGCSE
jgi:hypothetical protein